MAASFSSSCLNTKTLLIFHILVRITLATDTKFTVPGSLCKRLNSIISFGDSLADTGNILHLATSNNPPPHSALPPYGETYFHTPTGRLCNGRLIIDFLAEYLGIPLIPPYLGRKNHTRSANNFLLGVNFAVAGATAMDKQFFEQRGVHIMVKNISLGTQLSWFKELLPSLCQTVSDCQKLYKRSVVLVGEIGGNDYNHAFLAGLSKELVQTFVPPVVGRIASAITELIELGARSILVPGNLPIGCSAAYLTLFLTNSSRQDYDPKTGCLIWLNKFAEYHNQMLQTELSRIQKLYPQAKIIYADYYNAVMPLYLNPYKLGFSSGALRACCGGNGLYHYNPSVECGKPASTVCANPSLYVNWDGLHLTEAAYKFIFKRLFKGPSTVPPFKTLCTVSGF
ncbi:Sinapine esterase [Heracleum sosnowskyi]|uniref:Sinapine esterase n=1 Tax=Heracleum sosnowskyi TaxID=360622 RepID=A0AAD8MJY4_9APIA|nr:Sinapine esterase [Heracleum sosnowskyi]